MLEDNRKSGSGFGTLPKFVVYDPDTGTTGVGGTAVTDPVVDPPAEKTYTKAEFDAATARLRKSEEKKQADLKATYDKKIAEYEARIPQPSIPPTPPASVMPIDSTAPPTIAGALELKVGQLSRELEAGRKAQEDLKKKLDDERVRRINTERDSALTSALGKIGCLDIPNGRKILVDSCVYDETDGWLFKTKGENLVSVEDGVAEALPTYLRPPVMQGGGSGSSSGGKGASAAKAKEIEAEKKLLDVLDTKARQTSRDSDILAYRTQKSKVQQLERELAQRK